MKWVRYNNSRKPHRQWTLKYAGELRDIYVIEEDCVSGGFNLFFFAYSSPRNQTFIGRYGYFRACSNRVKNELKTQVQALHTVLNA
jgi:hypothetical protein